MALEVHVDDGVPLGLVHVETHLVAQDSGVVDEDIEATERVDCLRDEGLSTTPGRDVVVVRSCLSAGARDLVDHLLRGSLVRTFTSGLTAEIVDDDCRAFRREE